MNKIFSTIMFGAAVALAAGLSACSDDDNEVVVGPQSQGLYFPNNSQTEYLVGLDETTVNLTVMRTDDKDAVTAAIALTDESGLFSAPASVSFAAGEKTATIPVTFDANKFTPVDYTLILSIDSKDAYLYGITQFEFTVGWLDDLRWETYGTCQFNDSFFFDEFYETEMQKHVSVKGLYRIKSPYQAAYEAEKPSALSYTAGAQWIRLQLLAIGDKVGSIAITNEDLVKFNYYNSGMFINSYASDITVYYPGNLSGMTEANLLYSKVKSYQDDGTPNVVQLAPYYLMDDMRGWDKSSTDDMIRIVFPGGRLLDAAAEVEIAEVNIPEEGGAATIKANVALGADVEKARVALVQGNDIETANFLITHDRADYQTIEVSGEVTFTLAEDAEPGIYSVVASTYYKGKPAEYNYASFTYDPNAGKDWVLVGTGTYAYSLFFEGDNAGLELFQNVEDPTLYKIEHWGGDVDFLFTMDERNQIEVADQFIGYTHSSYGDVYVDDFVNYVGTVTEGISYYGNGIYNFNVVYYVQAGEFGWGYETFTLDSDEEGGTEAYRMPALSKQLKVKFGVENMSRRDLKLNRPLVKVEL